MPIDVAPRNLSAFFVYINGYVPDVYQAGGALVIANPNYLFFGSKANNTIVGLEGSYKPAFLAMQAWNATQSFRSMCVSRMLTPVKCLSFLFLRSTQGIFSPQLRFLLFFVSFLQNGTLRSNIYRGSAGALPRLV